ncbi:MAG: TetR/AcrR family transcriptional regulator [Chloroflexi bacterium]|nr:TetR/AcrR family transcriptional regulator [Chloroflexota bacterium]
MARKYELKRRAAHQDETRRRIIEATVGLHESVGGAKATISAIADRAGVERKTVYRHFPDERSLLTACTGHYLTLNPVPDPTPWAQIADPPTRLRTVFAAAYAYHRRTERMFVSAYRDLPDTPLLGELLAPYFAYWTGLTELLAGAWDEASAPGSLRRAAIGHALEFQTWRSLARTQGLDDAQIVDLMLGMVQSVAPPVLAGGA